MHWNLLETNPFNKMQCIKISETTPIFFSKDDFQRFLDAVGNNRMKDAFLFAVMTGMRRGEVLNLKWSDVKLEKKIAHIQSSTTYRVKAGKRRTIPLGDLVLKLFERFARPFPEWNSSNAPSVQLCCRCMDRFGKSVV